MIFSVVGACDPDPPSSVAEVSDLGHSLVVSTNWRGSDLTEVGNRRRSGSQTTTTEVGCTLQSSCVRQRHSLDPVAQEVYLREMADHPQNTRREFLTGQAARDVVGALIDGQISADERTSGSATPSTHIADRDEYLIKFARRAMACQFEFILPAAGPSEGAETAVAAIDLVDQLKQQLTVYRDSSELMAINRQAAEGPVPVESRLFELLQFAFNLSERTAGAYDITSGPLSQVWGFHRRQGRVPAQEEITEVLHRVGRQHVELNPTDQTIRFRASGVELNLGSIGKGYALDRCAELFRVAGVDRALLHGGQSSVLAVGKSAHASDSTQASASEGIPETSNASATTSDPGWTIGIGDPLRPGRRLALARLVNRAVGTSGSSVQFFRHAGRRYAHILDPRTGWPAEGLLSATVFAPTAAEADAYSTACYVLGLDGALRLCEEAGLAGAFVELPQGKNRSVVRTCGLNPEEFRLVETSGS